MFTKTGTTITQSTILAFDSGTTYSAGDYATFNSVTYFRKVTPATPVGVSILLSTNNVANNRTDKLTFGQVIGGGKSVMGLNNNQNVGTPGNAFTFGDTRFYREQPALALNVKIENWAGQIEADGILEVVYTATEMEFYNQDGTDIAANPTISGSNFGITFDPVQPTKTLTSGNPDVDTDHWTATTISTTSDEFLREKNNFLADIPGVGYEKLGNRHIYTIPSSDVFNIDGIVDIDTEYSKIIITAVVTSNSGLSKFDVRGTLNYGVKKSGKADPSNSTIYTGGVGLEFTGGFDSGNKWYGSTADTTAGSHFGLSGTLNINGGDIIGKFVFKPTTSATINNSYPAKMIIDSEGQTAGQEPLVRWKNPMVNVTALSIQGGQISYSVADVVVTLDKSAGGIAFWNQAQSNMSNTDPDGNYQVYKDCSVSENSVDFAGYTSSTITAARHSGSWFQNLESGSDINVNGGELGAQKQNSGTFVMGTKDIETNITSLVDGSDQKGVILIRDTNRFSNLADPIEEVLDDGVDYFDDDATFKYRGDFNGSITDWTATGGFAAGVLVASTDLNAVVLWTHQLNQDSALNRARGTQDVGIWKKAINSDSGTPGVDDYSMHVWSYDNAYVLHPSILTGKGVYTVNESVSDDPGIYLTLAEATSFEAGSDGDAITCTSTDIAIDGRVVDLETFYAIEKLRKTTDTSKEDVPTTGTMIVSTTADEIDFSTRTFSHSNSGGLKIGDGGDLSKVKHDTTLSFDDFDNAGLTMTALAFTTSGNTLTIKAGCKPIGTITRSTDLTITAENDADVSGLILAGSATFTLVGLPASSYNVFSTATTVDVFTRSIVIDTSAVSSTTFFRVLAGSTLATLSNSITFGSVSGATNSHTINLSSLTVSGLTLGDPLVVVVTAADGVDVRHVTTVQNLTDSITINANAAYNSGATAVAGDVAISVDSPITTMTLTLKAGISLGSANTNKTFNSVRSSQNYCDFIAFIGTSGSIVNSSQNATQLDAATNKLATIIDGTTTTAATVQGLILDNGAVLSTIFTAATFTGTGSIGLLLTADASVDYPAIGVVVKGVVQDPMIKASKDIPLNNNDF